ncbi:Kanadaptin [Lobosporangium transversale]|uniref:SMAD/FHA domain-containing protein n=1 Tax=Lobosporangium transversale TaxID=64571 RepID=A0A1Y2GB01_9FUNG|nr:hypothetical protein BCR41DRAFT_389419 [Lobosporangium transversale]KAF9914648.1 Kanadaptin [Lobosporangium transversale]ORZ05927.1 hypothetical protein BCR41DRAFT_389419 [Lobosporangium transversale]|eukprot:XP_021877308.1 hypothetical protein BCR41DRAFT_389419 [Lobosporangium transversale]
MSFAAPQASLNNAKTRSTDDVADDATISNAGSTAKTTDVVNDQDSTITTASAKTTGSVFAMPLAPATKKNNSLAMPPPPPPVPLFPKDHLQQQQHSKHPDQDSQANDSIPVTATTTTLKIKTVLPNAPPLKYQKPAWSGYPNQQFYFEVIKNGVIVEKIQAPEKEFLVIGRLPMCDLEMEHPSLSRYHAVVQFKSNGECFIYDLNSSHGTRLNKNKIPPGMHVSLKPGDQLRFGESTRIYLFQTEEVIDQEEEDRKLVATMIEKQNRSRSERQGEEQEEEEFNWGMHEDAMDEDEMDESMENGSTQRRAVDPDAYYRKDPKKALRHYLENKGYSCDYEVEESGPGHAREYTARVRLPIETAMGPVYGEATAGRRRDAEREAALDACIQLDSRGMLGQKSSGEGVSQAKTKKFEHSDDDDDDEFYDRTVKKKSSSIKKAEQKADTYESLQEKYKALQADMASIETKIRDYDTTAATRKELENSGDLDAYLASLEKSGGDSKAKMQQNLAAMKKEEKRLIQLIEFTKPIDIMAKIGAGAGVRVEVSSSSTNALTANKNTSANSTKRSNEPDTPVESETKKPRVLGPSLPPPLS